MKFKLICGLLTFGVFSAVAYGQGTSPKAAMASVSRAPTAVQIIEKYVKAIGGREAFLKFKTRTMKGTIELSPMGVKGPFEAFAAADDKTLLKANLTGIGELIDGYDGKVGWTVNPIQGSRVKAGQELLQVKQNSSFYREINLDKTYSKLEANGTEKIGDKTANIVLATSEGLHAETLYFDTESGLLLRADSTSVTPEGSQPIKNFYEDYRDSDGMKLPFKTRTVTAAFEIITLVTEVKNGVPIEDAKFAQPK